MATGYYVDDKPLEDLVAKKSDALQQMITSSNFFTLPEYNLNDQFGSASPNYNGGTWGVPINTGYYKEGSPVPFIDPRSIPNPYLVKKSDGTFVRQFPESDWTDNYGTGGKFIPGSDIEKTGIIISYDDQQQLLTVKKGAADSTPFVVKCYSYILIDIQAPGGAGGAGIGDWDNWSLSNWFALSGGGGGSSGGFVSLSVNLNTINGIEIKDPDPQSSTHYKVTYQGNQSHTLNIGKGANGKSGKVKAEPGSIFDAGYTLSATGGNSQEAYNINIDDGTDMPSGFNDNIFIIEAYSGNIGAAGSRTTTKWTDRANNTTNGTSAGAINSSILLTSIPGSAITCTLYNSEIAASGGCGELTSNPKAAPLIAGGGGGGASLMANGASHGDGKIGIGAGGYGGSAWSGDDTQLFGTEVCDWLLTPYNDVIKGLSQPGSGGGPGAMWIYYKPLICNLTINIATLTWLQAGYPGASFGTTKTDKVAYFLGAQPVEYIQSGATQEYTVVASGYTPSGSLILSLGKCTNADCTLTKTEDNPSGNRYKLCISNVVGDVSINIIGTTP